MLDLFFSGSAVWFTVPALVGTAFFVIRLAAMMSGLGADAHADVGVHDAHADPSDGFKVLSVQAVLAFCMGFGWGGLGALKGGGLSVGPTIAVALLCGAGMMILLHRILKLVYGMQSSGNIDPRTAVGHEAEVYVRVPARGEGRGQVRLSIDNRSRFYDAVSEDGPLERSARVRVVAFNEDRTVTVSLA